jgi:hypothetical protein
VEAQVTLKVTPAEFDLLRNSIEARVEHLNELINSEERSTATPRERQEWRQLVVQLTDLIKKLR